MMGEKSKWFLKTFTDFFCRKLKKKSNITQSTYREPIPFPVLHRSD